MLPDYYDIYELSNDAPWNLSERPHEYSERAPFGLAAGGMGERCLLVIAREEMGFSSEHYLECLLSIAFIRGLIDDADYLIAAHGTPSGLASLPAIGMNVLYDPTGRYKGLLSYDDFSICGNSADVRALRYVGELDEEMRLLAASRRYWDSCLASRMNASRGFALLKGGRTLPGDFRHKAIAAVLDVPYSVIAWGFYSEKQVSFSDKLEETLEKWGVEFAEFFSSEVVDESTLKDCRECRDAAELGELAYDVGQIWFRHTAEQLDEGAAGRILAVTSDYRDTGPCEQEALVFAAGDELGIPADAAAYVSGVPLKDIVA